MKIMPMGQPDPMEMMNQQKPKMRKPKGAQPQGPQVPPPAQPGPFPPLPELNANLLEPRMRPELGATTSTGDILDQLKKLLGGI